MQYDIAVKRKNTIIFTITIVAPVGVSRKYEAISPETKHITDTSEELMITLL